MNEVYEYLFHQGTLHDAYNFMGAIWSEEKTYFRVWAPSAYKVTLIGDFNDWNERELNRITSNGIWEISVGGVKKGQEYKFAVYSATGKRYKSDPYAKQTNTREFTNSIVSDHDFEWTDGHYMVRRNKRDIFSSPMNIYEAHIGSYKRGLSYRQFADEVAPYLKDMGYTHLELMGISEYPLDDSWGYQVTGYFSPTRRYGNNGDFAYLVNKMHEYGIGVILDWVPGHFPRNDEALFRFDGSELYEKSGIMGEHKEWGTCCFDYARNEVRSFLISSAMMWIKEYHVDGLRVDAVASMLYLDYGRTEWYPNEYGGNENIAAIDFLRQLNSAIHTIKGAFTVAEESTTWPHVTGTDSGGLGFDFKWDMGWMHDTLKYLSTDSLFRKYEHNKMTFSLMYAFNEKYVLPISHDEVVYGKGSLINKAAGCYEHKFGAIKAYLAMMYAHPGKKLLFMGCELGQFDEWDFKGELGWNLLGYDSHRQLHEYVKKLNNIYCKYKSFFADDSWNGFNWKVADDRDRNIFVIERKFNGESIIIAVNFSPAGYEKYFVGTERKDYKLLLSDNLLGKNADFRLTADGIELNLCGYDVIILRAGKERRK